MNVSRFETTLLTRYHDTFTEREGLEVHLGCVQYVVCLKEQISVKKYLSLVALLETGCQIHAH